MWYVAFTLGLFGSLHCVGMCGPLAIAFCNREGDDMRHRLSSSLGYNLGRTLTYTFLGLIFGLLGSFLFVADIQKALSIFLGGLLVFSFMMSVDIDAKINSLPAVKRVYDRLRIAISNLYNQTKKYPPFILGMANGLLPCGLVYLALTGALTSGDLVQGMIFMALFGLGTIPMLVSLVMGVNLVSPKFRSRFRKVLPYVTLGFGLFLIYRGVMIDLPVEMNFWEALKNPIMCH